MAHEAPHLKISSTQIESQLSSLYERLCLSPSRLESITGIVNRGYFEHESPSDISCLASKNLFHQLDGTLKPYDDIDMVLHTSVCRDFLEPATASRVHSLLELSENAMAFDLSNACLGFMNGIEMAQMYLKANKSLKHILVVSGENAYPLYKQTIKKMLDEKTTRKDVKKWMANLTIGSAGVAYLISSEQGVEQFKQRNPNFQPKAEILGQTSMTDSSSVHLCQGSGDMNALHMETQTKELMVKGLALAEKTFQLYKTQVDASPHVIVTHQVGKAHAEALKEVLGLNRPGEYKVFETYQEFGNTGSCACPLTLAFHQDQIESGMRVAMLGIGSGLQTIMMGVKWC